MIIAFAQAVLVLPLFLFLRYVRASARDIPDHLRTQLLWDDIHPPTRSCLSKPDNHLFLFRENISMFSSAAARQVATQRVSGANGTSDSCGESEV